MCSFVSCRDLGAHGQPLDRAGLRVGQYPVRFFLPVRNSHSVLSSELVQVHQELAIEVYVHGHSASQKLGHHNESECQSPVMFVDLMVCAVTL